MEQKEAQRTEDSLAEQFNKEQSENNDSKVSERLEKFVKVFIKQFEDKLEAYSKEVKPGVKAEKVGKATEKVTGAITAAGPVAGFLLPGSSKIVSPIKEAATYVSKRNHRKKARKCIDSFTIFQDNKDNARKILAEASCRIYQSFEDQFTRITDSGKSWTRGIEKLAIDAVDRIMNYVDKNKDEVEHSSVFITRCIVMGESKKSILAMASLSEPGFTVRFEGSTEDFHTSELYSKTGILKLEDDVLKYFRKNSYKRDDSVEKYGYRLAFDWELERWDELGKEFGIVKTPPDAEYKYILEQEKIEEIISTILKGMDEKDPVKASKVIKELVMNNNETGNCIHEIVTGIDDNLKTLLKQKKEIGAVFFKIEDEVDSFKGRRKELNKLHSLVERHSEEVTVRSRMTSITGLGGVGKTQLVRRYINEQSDNYDNILWMNAEKYETLAESFLELAGDERVAVATEDRNGRVKDIKSIAGEVYRCFANGSSLFVFDNAETYSMKQEEEPGKNRGIVEFLPLSLTGYATSPRFIITSRNQKWPEGVEILALDVFTEEEAAQFIEESLNIGDNESDQINRLAHTLDRFPLALQQAVAYIRVTNEKLKRTGSTFGINDYLMKYGKVTKALLGFPFPQDSNVTYLKTTLNTWKITIDKFRDNSEFLPALNILNVIAYIAPENIPVDIFLSLECINKDKEILGGAIEQLLQHSMVSSGKHRTALKVHRLVQQVTRMNLEEEKRDDEFKKMTYDLFDENYPYFNEKVEDHAKKRQLLPHLEAFFSHMDDRSNKKDEDVQEFEINYIVQLLTWMSDAHDSFSNPRSVKMLLERVLAIEEKYYGPDHFKVAKTLTNLANAHGDLGDPQRKKVLLERALDIKVKHYGPDHVEVAITLSNLANALGKLGDVQKKKELLERTLAIEESHYGPDHFEVAKTLSNLANAHGDLGDAINFKLLLERALENEEKYYGPDHFEVAATLNNLGNAHGDLGNTEKQKELLERALAIKEKHYGPDHFVVAITLSNLANAYGKLGDPQKKKELLERALTNEEKHFGSNHFEVASTLNNLGNAHGDLGDTEKQKELLERSLAIKEKHYGLDHFMTATSLSSLANAYGKLGDSQKRKELLERTLAIEESHYGPDHVEVAKTLLNLASIHGELGDHQKKKTMLERALAIEEQFYGPGHFEVAATLNNLGNVHGDLGDHEKQKDLLERSLAIKEQHHGPDHYEVASTLNNLGIAHGDLGDHQKKKEFLERTLVIEENHYGPDHLEVAKTLSNLANTHGKLGDHQKKKTLLERVLSTKEKCYGRDHLEVAKTLSHLADTYGKLGDHQNEKTLLERVLTIEEKQYGSDHLEVSETLSDLATAHGKLENYQKKKTLLERVLSIEEKQYGPNHIEVAFTLNNLGNVCGDLGDHEAQKDLLERALAIKEQHYGPDHFKVALTLNNLGIAHGDLGDHQKKKELLEKTLAIEEKHYGSDHNEIARTLCNLANAHGELGDTQKQKELRDRALAIKEKNKSSDH